MWRGVPLANTVAETLAGSNSQRTAGGYGDATVNSTLYPRSSNVRQLLRSLGIDFLGLDVQSIEDERLPTWQVMAVESPWLRYLNRGIFPDGTSFGSENFPFRTGVGYGSIVGDDSDYTMGWDLYGKFHQWQQPSLFPYFALETAVGQERAYSDGIVPYWSAAIPGSFKPFPYDHAQLIKERPVVNQVLYWLNSASLPSGEELRPKWEETAEAPKARDDLRKRWTFPAGSMAPYPQSGLYEMRDIDEGTNKRYVARFLPDTIHESSRLVVVPEKTGLKRLTVRFPAKVRINFLGLYIVDLNGSDEA